MGFRFHKAFSIIPGVKLNISKSGPSVSVGGHGLTENFSMKGERSTVGLPGTGVSYTEKQGRGATKNWFGIIVMIVAIGYALYKNLYN